MSADLKADILKAAHDAEHMQNKQNKKVIKRCIYFIIKFPNGAESLIISINGWAGLNDYVKYFKDANVAALWVIKYIARNVSPKNQDAVRRIETAIMSAPQTGKCRYNCHWEYNPKGAIKVVAKEEN